MSEPEPFSPEEAIELRRMLSRSLEATEKLTAGLEESTAQTRAVISAHAALQVENDELREALRAILGTVNKLKACVLEYHGSPLEESVNDDLRPVRALLARHGTQAPTGKAGT